MIRTWLQHLAAAKKFALSLMAKKSFWVFFAVVLVVLLVPANVVFAQTSYGGGIANAILDKFSQALFALANIAMRLTVMSLSLFLELAAYNDFITSPPVIVGWFMVRDVANMFFIVVLLIIAFATVLGIEQYEWKKTLGKLIIAAVLINFSKLILQLIIDVANIFTVTFLNAVRATAAGNLINMFNFDTLLQIRQNANLTGTSDFRLDIFGAAVTALVLAVMAMSVMVAYMIILVTRVVVLWVLMILSPLAFLLQAVPSGKKYADEFWSEFTKHVMVAPLMTFFLWLTFATLGNGNIASDIGINTSAVSEAGANAPQIDGVDGSPAVALSEASTWESMSNFIISLGFLMIGIMAVQRLNVQAGGLAGGAVDFGKKVATIASGYAVGRWAVGKGRDLGIDYLKPTFQGIKGEIGARWYRSRAQKEKDYAKWEKDQQKAGRSGLVTARRALGFATGGIFGESAARRAKRASDWSDAAEREKKIRDERFGTGSTTRGGKYKTNATARLNIEEEGFIAEKKEQKIEREKRKILSGKFSEGDYASATAKEMYEATAGIRQDRKMLRREREIFDAENDAKVLIKEGRHAEAAARVESAYKKQYKEDNETMENLGYKAGINQAVKLVEQLKAENTKGAELSDIAKQARQDNLRLLAIAAETDEEQFNDMLDAMIEKIYGEKQELTSENFGQRLLEAATGKQINNYQDFDDAHKLLEENATFRNTAESQAVMGILSTNLKKLGTSHNMRAVGSVVETTGDKNVAIGRGAAKIGSQNAPTAYRFMVNPNFADAPATVAADDLSSKQGVEDYLETRGDLKKTPDISRFMNVKGEVSQGMNDTQKTHLQTVLSSFGDKREVSAGFTGTFAKYNGNNANFEGNAKNDLLQVLAKVKNDYVVNKEVFDHLMKTQFSSFIGETYIGTDGNQETLRLWNP